MANRRLGVLAVAVLVVGTSLSMSAGVVSAQEPDTSLWVTNGPVNAIVGAGGTIYIGGSFTHMGPPTGSFVRMNSATGTASRRWP